MTNLTDIVATVIVRGGRTLDYTRLEVLELLAYCDNEYIDSDNIPKWVRQSTLDIEPRALLVALHRLPSGQKATVNLRSDDPGSHYVSGAGIPVNQKPGMTITFDDVRDTVRVMFTDSLEEGGGYPISDIAIAVQDGIDHSDDEPGTSFRWLDLTRALDDLVEVGTLAWDRATGEYTLAE